MVINVDDSSSLVGRYGEGGGAELRHDHYLVAEQAADGATYQHVVSSGTELTSLLEDIWNADPERSVQVFRLDEVAVSRRQEYRVEVTGVSV
ncbi:MAG: hypothetical protein ACK5RL_21325 [Acidimicrobiales bacterium]